MPLLACCLAFHDLHCLFCSPRIGCSHAPSLPSFLPPFLCLPCLACLLCVRSFLDIPCSLCLCLTCKEGMQIMPFTFCLGLRLHCLQKLSLMAFPACFLFASFFLGLCCLGVRTLSLSLPPSERRGIAAVAHRGTRNDHRIA